MSVVEGGIRFLLIAGSALTPVGACFADQNAIEELLVRFHEPPTSTELEQIRMQFPTVAGWRSPRHVNRPKNGSAGEHPLAYVRIAALVNQLDRQDAVEFCASIVATAPSLMQHAEPNNRVEFTGFGPNDPLYAKQWGPTAICAPGAWAVTMGSSSVIVAVIDTGLQFDHEEFPSDALWTNPGETPDNGIDDDSNGFVDDVVGWDFHFDDNSPDDEFIGHGTWVTGVVGARMNNSVGIAGMANVSMMTLRFDGALDAASAALYYAVDMGAHVINCSWVTSVDHAELAMALDYARANGVTVVAAAGNDGYRFRNFPAAYPSVIGVSGTTIGDASWQESTSGPWYDVAAPAEGILSTTTPNLGWYRFSNGTSAASPYVAGLAALLYSVDLSLRPEEVQGFISAYADDLGEAGFDELFGHGRVNAAHTVAAVLNAVSCPADVNRDGTVGVADVLSVLANWQTADWEADINDSGAVDFADLLTVLESWGACPS